MSQQSQQGDIKIDTLLSTFEKCIASKKRVEI
jgi:hypothetical protein